MQSDKSKIFAVSPRLDNKGGANYRAPISLCSKIARWLTLLGFRATSPAFGLRGVRDRLASSHVRDHAFDQPIGFVITDRGSRIMDRGSWITDRGSQAWIGRDHLIRWLSVAQIECPKKPL